MWHLLPFKQQGWHWVNIRDWEGEQLPGLEAGLQLRGKVHLPRTEPVSSRGHPAFDRRELLLVSHSWQKQQAEGLQTGVV